jgi:hypothetical protein
LLMVLDIGYLLLPAACRSSHIGPMDVGHRDQ